jgi:starch synthase
VKILIAVSEVVPYAKTGGLADVAGALPKEFAKLGHDVRLVMPRYEKVRHDLEPVKTGLGVELTGERVGFDVRRDTSQGYEALFIDCPKFFDRPGLYGEEGADYPDNAARFAFFARAVLAAAEALDFRPDVVHCHDWQSALVPLYLKRGGNPYFGETASLFTIHNLAYMGNFPPEEALPLVGLGEGLFTAEGGVEYYGKVNYLKAGLVFADVLTTVSPTYSKEIQTPEFGYGLEGVLHSRTADLFGVLNGIDYELWNPATDANLAAGYSGENPAGKAVCKTDLQREYGLPERRDVPLFGMVTRLADQKGLDLFAKAAEDFFAKNLQFALLGTGDPKYHELFTALASKYPERCGVRLAYDAALAQRIYAGADLFVMPSRYEPCGLGQLIALSYGTLPLVRATGGLADTIDEGVNGFVFTEYVPSAFLDATKRALAAFSENETWEKLVRRAFAARYSWGQSAERYVELFSRARTKRLRG